MLFLSPSWIKTLALAQQVISYQQSTPFTTPMCAQPSEVTVRTADFTHLLMPSNLYHNRTICSRVYVAVGWCLSLLPEQFLAVVFGVPSDSSNRQLQRLGNSRVKVVAV
ncbi:hypothetical protein PBY51_023323 [Eleginops maclovinus]|uniref:Uncharacterized protein n=1 Tax=Eleginops maclovinus TaxID=56733 RepID=A0AAN7WZR4_ELEMC|nr:hypothetical protein PBY51_023323 [Eleginops maclovinus]